MSEPDLIQKQRTILHTFRQATVQRAKSETDAGARRKSDCEATDVALNQIRQTATNHLAEAHKAQEQAQAALTQVGLQHLLEHARPTPPIARPGVDQTKELSRSVSLATGAAEGIQAGIEALQRWRKEGRARLYRRLAVNAALLLGTILLIIFTWRGFQPCGWVDSLLGHPSGCLHTLSGHGNSVSSIVFSLDGRTIASGSYDKTVRLWDVASGQEVRTLGGHKDGVNSVAFSPDGKTLASGSVDKTVKLWDVASGRELRTLSGHTGTVYSMAFSPDGKTLASAGGDKVVKLWDMASGREVRTLSGHNEGVNSAVFSLNGKVLASGSGDKTVKLWDVASGRELRTLGGHTGAVSSVAFSPDGKTLASGGGDNTARLWDVASGLEVHTLSGHTGTVVSVAFSPDGKTLASGSGDKKVKLWDVASGREVLTISGYGDRLWSVAFSPDGKVLASGGGDKTVKLWGVASKFMSRVAPSATVSGTVTKEQPTGTVQAQATPRQEAATLTPTPTFTPTHTPTATHTRTATLPTSTATSTHTPTPIPPTPEPTPLPQNVREFRGAQWKYLMEEGGRNSGRFIPMPQFDDRCYRTGTWEKDVRICAEGEVLPGWSTRIAYEWTSDAAGKLRIKVHAHKMATWGGDGVNVRTWKTFADGRPQKNLGEFRIAAADNVGRTEFYEDDFSPGDKVYVVIDIWGEPTYDETRLYIDIYRR